MSTDRTSNVVDTVLAFSFGNRIDPAQDPGRALQSGPVNEALADVAFRLQRLFGAKIWAQWEIAAVMETAYQLPTTMLHAVHPVRGANDDVRYLSTRGVIDVVLTVVGGAGSLGRVAVVAHSDHVRRCVRVCRERSIAAVSAADVASSGDPALTLPSFYDPESGQPWTRTRVDYLKHEQKMLHR